MHDAAFNVLAELKDERYFVFRGFDPAIFKPVPAEGILIKSRSCRN